MTSSFREHGIVHGLTYLLPWPTGPSSRAAGPPSSSPGQRTTRPPPAAAPRDAGRTGSSPRVEARATVDRQSAPSLPATRRRSRTSPDHNPNVPAAVATSARLDGPGTATAL